jgi:tartrate dehydrogenase/decarboxylase/D-malate dehydrogenase
MATNAYRISVIPGDGIGKEVVPEGIRVLDTVAARYGLSFSYAHLDWSCEQYKATGRIMPADGIDRLRDSNAIFLGAVGFPGVPDHISLWGMLIPIRRAFRQFANVRPVRLLKGIDCPLKNRAPGEIDMIIVRENTEGEYSEIGGRLYRGQPEEVVVQEAIFTRIGVDRVMRHAFDIARTRPRRKVTSATKSNGIIHTMPFWDERFAEIRKDYPGIETDQFHIDILCAHFVQHPDWFDVVVASNLFGDILTDLGPAVVGGIGIAPSGNLNPSGEFPSMFEPVHGSAPDIAGKGIANPIGQIWSAAMMLEHLGHKDAAQSVMRAIEDVLANGGPRTRDLGGNASTVDVGKAIAAAIR